MGRVLLNICSVTESPCRPRLYLLTTFVERSGNAAATDHYTTLIMLSVNSGCKYPREHIGPSGKQAHITTTHTVRCICPLSRHQSQSISAT